MAFDPYSDPIGEVRGFPKEWYRDTSFTALRRVRVDWTDRYNWAAFFADAHYYPYTLIEGGGTGAIAGIGIEPDVATKLTYGEASVSQAVYGKALLTLGYRASGYDGDVLIEELHPRHETILVGGRQFSFADGTTLPKGYGLAKHTGGYTLTITYPRLRAAPTTFLYLQDRINFDAFVPRMFYPLVFYPHRLLYLSGDVQGILHHDGTTRYSAQHIIWAQATDWNYVFNPTSGEFEPIYTTVDGELVEVVKYGEGVFTGSV